MRPSRTREEQDLYISTTDTLLDGVGPFLRCGSINFTGYSCTRPRQHLGKHMALGLSVADNGINLHIEPWE